MGGAVVVAVWIIITFILCKEDMLIHLSHDVLYQTEIEKIENVYRLLLCGRVKGFCVGVQIFLQFRGIRI